MGKELLAYKSQWGIDLFHIHPRLGRVDFIALQCLYALFFPALSILTIIIVFAIGIGGRGNSAVFLDLIGKIAVVISILFWSTGFINQFLLILRRFHDLNLSGMWAFALYSLLLILSCFKKFWMFPIYPPKVFYFHDWSLMNFIPLVVLSFLPGTQSTNQFGPAPGNPRLISYNLLWITCLALFIYMIIFLSP